MVKSANNHKFSEETIADILEKNIVENGIAPGVRLTTAPELARQYQVCVKTADRAILRLVKRGLVARQRGSGTFVKSNLPRIKKTKIALFLWRRRHEMPELDYAAFGRFDEILLFELEKHGYRYDIFYMDSDMKEKSAIFNVTLAKYDVVIAVAGIQDAADPVLRQAGHKVILFCDDQVRQGPWHQVVYDYIPGFCKAIRFFKDKGYRKFFVAGHNDATSHARIEAIRQAGRMNDLPDSHFHVYCGKCNLGIQPQILAGCDCADYYLKNDFSRYPVISTNDFISMGMLEAFSQKGLRPGADFKLISYDNLEMRIGSEKFPVGLSSITHPQEAHARAVVAMLENITRIRQTGDFYQTYFVPAQEICLRTTT